MSELPPLKPSTEKLLRILKYFDGKKVTLLDFAMMLGLTRRRVRMMISELRTKGYIRVIPENMAIHHTNALRFIFMDEPPKTIIGSIDQSILDRLGIKPDD